MKRISNQSMVEILTRIIEMLQADGCEGCVSEMNAEWEHPCSICKRSMWDYYRKEIKSDESTST